MLEVPPLRERPEDIARLAREVLGRLTRDMHRSGAELTSDALAALAEHSWPGNLRELRNVLERALLLSPQNDITRAYLRFEGAAPRTGEAAVYPTSSTLRDVEIRHIMQVLGEERGKVPAAAERLGVPKSSLYQKIKTYQIDPSDFR